MELQFEDDENKIRTITLTGRLDTAGVAQVEVRFNALMGPKTKNVILNMTCVEFLSSMGIRMLVTAARTCHRHHGKLVILSPQALVAEALETASLTDVIPIAASVAEAE